MKTPFVQSLCLDGFLSFAPGSQPIQLDSLNVLIGPNGSGKSNVLDAFAVLNALPLGEPFQALLRAGGGPDQWIWRGGRCDRAVLDLRVRGDNRACTSHYRCAFASQGQFATFLEETFEDDQDECAPTTYFRIDGNRVHLATKYVGAAGPEERYTFGVVDRQYLRTTESLLHQRRVPESFPDTSWLASQFEKLRLFREWRFGPRSEARLAQQTAAPTDPLLPDTSNLAMVVQDFEHRGVLGPINSYLRRFFPRFERLSTRVSGGTILLYLYEDGLTAPVPATRISDGTLRWIALLLVLLDPAPPPVLCIEEPELGLHPDAVSILAELFVDARTRTQLIVTTHSDTLISALTEHAESVLVTEHLGGGTRLTRVESDKLRYWLERYKLGEIWRIGELGGNL